MPLALEMLTEIQNPNLKTTVGSSSTTFFTMAVKLSVLTICILFNVLSHIPFPQQYTKIFKTRNPHK